MKQILLIICMHDQLLHVVKLCNALSAVLWFLLLIASAKDEQQLHMLNITESVQMCSLCKLSSELHSARLRVIHDEKSSLCLQQTCCMLRVSPYSFCKLPNLKITWSDLLEVVSYLTPSPLS